MQPRRHRPTARAKMPLSTRRLPGLGSLSALVLLSSVCLGASLPIRQNEKTAADAFRARTDFPLRFASDPIDIASRLKSLEVAAAGSPGQAAIRLEARDRAPISAYAPAHETQRPGPRGACERSGSDICYDVVDRRIVYRPIRRYMLQFDGLTAENVSLRRDAIRFRYSFR